MLCTELYALIVFVKSPHSLVPRSFGFLTQTTRAYNPVRRTFYDVNYNSFWWALRIRAKKLFSGSFHFFIMFVVVVVRVQKFPTNFPVYRKEKNIIQISCAVGRCFIHYHSLREKICVALVHILNKLSEVALTELWPL